IDELAKDVEGKFKVGKVNVDENSEIASKYGIMSIPAIKIFKGGEIVKEFTGVQDKDSLKTELESIE
ncbi:thioredoxin family protein, partial [Patescibacteria group bacterium]